MHLQRNATRRQRLQRTGSAELHLSNQQLQLLLRLQSSLGEECLAGAEDVYIWRARIPFNHQASPRNYLTKLQTYDSLLQATNSLSQLDEFVRAAWQCWDKRVPPGTYHMTNPGVVTTRLVTDLIREYLHPNKQFRFFADEQEFMRVAARTPRSNCLLDSSKLKAVGIPLTSVVEAIERALRHWSDAPDPARLTCYGPDSPSAT